MTLGTFGWTTQEAQLRAYDAVTAGHGFTLPLRIGGSDLQCGARLCRDVGRSLWGTGWTYGGTLPQRLAIPCAGSWGQAWGTIRFPHCWPLPRVMGAKGLTGIISGDGGVETKVAFALRHFEGPAGLLILDLKKYVPLNVDRGASVQGPFCDSYRYCLRHTGKNIQVQGW